MILLLSRSKLSYLNYSFKIVVLSSYSSQKIINQALSRWMLNENTKIILNAVSIIISMCSLFGFVHFEVINSPLHFRIDTDTVVRENFPSN